MCTIHLNWFLSFKQLYFAYVDVHFHKDWSKKKFITNAQPIDIPNVHSDLYLSLSPSLATTSFTIRIHFEPKHFVTYITHKNINKLSKLCGGAKCGIARFFFSLPKRKCKRLRVVIFLNAYNWLWWHVSAINFCSICYFNMIIIIIIRIELSLLALFRCTRA